MLSPASHHPIHQGAIHDRRRDLAPIEAKLSGLEGRIASIPTTWQTIAIISALLVGIAGLSLGIAKLTEKPAAFQAITPAPQTPAPAPRRP